MARSHRIRRHVIGCALVATLALSAAPALGQLGTGDPSASDGDGGPAVKIIRPEKAATPGPTPRWLYYLIMCALGVGAVGVTIMPSQRTHQD